MKSSLFLRPIANLLLCAATLQVSTFAGDAGAQPSRAGQYYDDALKYFERNDLNAATIQLKNAINADKTLLSAHLLLGRVLLRNGELKGAEAALEEALKLGVVKSEVAPLLGQVYLQLGEARKALDITNGAGATAELLTLRGSAFAMQGNQRQAADTFADARKADPKSAAPLVAEAPILLRAGERDKARAAAERGVELAPANSFAWYQLGTIAQALGDLKGALSAFDKALALNSKHADSHVSRAMVLLSLGKQTEAEAVLSKLKLEGVREPRASWLRGMFAQDKGDVDLARSEFTDAVAMIDPLPPAVLSGSEPLLLAGALSHKGLGNRERVREYLSTLLGRNSRHYAAQLLMATVLLEDRELNRAKPILENLLRAAPDNERVLYMLGTLHLERKQYAQAAEYLELASSKRGNQAAMRELSFTQFGLGQNKSALALLEKVHAANPRDLRAGVELAVVYARMGQGAKALQVAQALVKLDPDNLAMVNFLGNVKGRLGDRKGMRATYQSALNKDPKFRPVVINMSWLDIEEGRLDDARLRLGNYLKENPKDPDILLQLGLLEQRASRPAEALKLFQQGDTMQTKDPRPGLAAVNLLLSARQDSAALAAARTLVGKYPEHVPALLALGRAHLQGGDRRQARASLQEATKLAGFSPGVLVEIARLQLAADNPDGAVHAANKALQERADDPGALTILVDIAARRGSAADVDKALATLQSKQPKHPSTLITSGHVAMSRNQPGKAYGLYRQVFDAQPSTPLAVLVAQALLANKEAPKAATLMESWSKRNPTDMVALRALAELQLASGRADAAKGSYKQVMLTEPNDASHVAAYARLLALTQDPEALAAAERAFKMSPQNPSVADVYGWLLVERGDLDNGIRVLRDARLRDPANASLRWHLTAALTKANRKAEAGEELRSTVAAKLEAPPGVSAAKIKAELGL